MSIQLAHPWGTQISNTIWSTSFAVALSLSLVLSLTFIPLLACATFAFLVALIARTLLVNKRLGVPSLSAVIVTGTSTGIGYDTALRLAESGLTVFATVRKQTDADKLNAAAKSNPLIEAHKLRPLILDVTNLQQLESAVKSVDKQLSESNLQLWALVANAGVSQGGSVELVPLKSVRQQFEVNVFGQIAFVQAFLPQLRKFKKQGYNARILLVSSVVGHLSMPGNAIYCASKHALEAIGDGLRSELAKWSISVSLVEPGGVKTSFMDTMKGNSNLNAAEPEENSVSHTVSKEVRESYVLSQAKLEQMGEKAYLSLPNTITDVIATALTDSRPLGRYLAGADAAATPIILTLVPTVLMDAMFRFAFK